MMFWEINTVEETQRYINRFLPKEEQFSIQLVIHIETRLFLIAGEN